MSSTSFLGSRQERQSHCRQKLFTRKFYEDSNWFEMMMEILFKIKSRGVTIKSEVYCGVIQFVSCLYVVAVVPQMLVKAGYGSHETFVVTTLCCSIGSIICGLFANLPFIIVPPTAVSIFLSVFMRQHAFTVQQGDTAVIISGIALILLGYRPLGQLLCFLIPSCIQVGVAIGIGLFTALAGATEVDLIVVGQYTIVTMGSFSAEIAVCLTGLVIIAICMHYHVKASFCVSLLFTTLFWWSFKDSFPHDLMELPTVDRIESGYFGPNMMILLVFDLFFLYILFLNGLVFSLSDLAKLTRSEDGTVPRGRWIYVVCGLLTIISGVCSGAPVLVSPESAAGIKAGARTGLSTVVCGILFAFSIFFSPVFMNVPACGTSALLIMIGVVLFQNCSKTDWHVMKEAVPCFCTLFFICTTYSILLGTAIGMVLYLAINFFTGDIEVNIRTVFRSIKSSFKDAYGPVGSSFDSDESQKPIISVVASFINNLLAAMEQAEKVSVPLNMGYPEMLGEEGIRSRTSSQSSRHMSNASDHDRDQDSDASGGISLLSDV